MNNVNHPKTRRLQLCVDSIETIDDVKKILNLMKIRIDTDNPEYEEVKKYFSLEIVPKGYFALLKKIGWEGINQLNYDEIEKQAALAIDEYETKVISVDPNTGNENIFLEEKNDKK
jgi:hypothetical protein